MEKKIGVSRVAQVATMVGGLALAGVASAQSTGLDVSGITSALADATAGIGTVALAMLGVAGAGMAVKWLLGFVFS